jgi:hypothetical protein
MIDEAFFEGDEDLRDMQAYWNEHRAEGPWVGAKPSSETNRVTYFAVHLDTGAIKIGQSSDPERRKAELERKFGGRIQVLTSVESGLVERELHDSLGQWCIGKEWYKPAPEVLIALFSALDRHRSQE